MEIRLINTDKGVISGYYELKKEGLKKLLDDLDYNYSKLSLIKNAEGVVFVGRNSKEEIEKRHEYMRDLIEENNKLTRENFVELISKNFSISEQQIKKDMKEIGIYESGATRLLRLKKNTRRETRKKLSRILRSELLSVLIKKETGKTTKYTYSSEEPECSEDNEIIIMPELSGDGFEHVIAKMLSYLYSSKIYMISVGYGGLIIYPYKNEGEKIIEYLRECL